MNNLKNISELKDYEIEYQQGISTLKTYKDDTYVSKSKFVFDVSQLVNSVYYDINNFCGFFKPFEIPKDIDRLYFSMSYKPNITVGEFSFTVHQLKGDYDDYMSDYSNNETWLNNIVKTDSVTIKSSFEDRVQRIEKEIIIDSNANSILLDFGAEFIDFGGYLDESSPLSTQSLRYKLNDLFVANPDIKVFNPTQGEGGLGSLWKESFQKKRLTYFISDEVPAIPSNLNELDFSNVWLCPENIVINDVVVYEKDTLYGLKTSINYANNTHQVVGWEKLDLTKEDIDKGVEKYFFVGWNLMISQLINISQWRDSIFQGGIEFGDILFSTINYLWSPAEGESAIDTDFQFNKDGIFIENQAEGFKREISASTDKSTNLQTGKDIWYLTPEGQWVNLLEAREIRIGNFHIVEENEELKFYHRHRGGS